MSTCKRRRRQQHCKGRLFIDLILRSVKRCNIRNSAYRSAPKGFNQSDVHCALVNYSRFILLGEMWTSVSSPVRFTLCHTRTFQLLSIDNWLLSLIHDQKTNRSRIYVFHNTVYCIMHIIFTVYAFTHKKHHTDTLTISTFTMRSLEKQITEKAKKKTKRSIGERERAKTFINTNLFDFSAVVLALRGGIFVIFCCSIIFSLSLFPFCHFSAYIY